MFPPQPPSSPQPDKPWEPERFLSSDAYCYFCNRWVAADHNRWTWMVCGTTPDAIFLAPVHNDCLTIEWELRLPDDGWNGR